MAIKIKNWKLALLALLFFACFMGLGYWQLSRAKQKEALLATFAARAMQPTLIASQLQTNRDLRFYQATLRGHFENNHNFLLDNKIHDGKIGYEIYTPFIAHNMRELILVDRGFIQLKGSRQQLPTIAPIQGDVTITGLLNLPPRYVSLGQMPESTIITWPLRIEYIDLREMLKLLPSTTRSTKDFFPYILQLKDNHAASTATAWQIVTMPPERHRGYAIQWFALALTLLILFVALNISY